MNRNAYTWPWHTIPICDLSDPQNANIVSRMERILLHRDPFSPSRYRTLKVEQKDGNGSMRGCHFREAEFMFFEWPCPRCGARVTLHLDMRDHENETDEYDFYESDNQISLPYFMTSSCGICRTQFKVFPNARQIKVWKLYRVRQGPKTGRGEQVLINT